MTADSGTANTTATAPSMDLRQFLFAPLEARSFRFAIIAREAGVLSGAAALSDFAADLGIRVISTLPEGSVLVPGAAVLVASGSAEQVAKAEETLIGIVGKPSGVATAAAGMVRRAGGVRVVCGAWKKVPGATRRELRQAIATGGAGIRISDQPFIYLDKNYVRMLGGVGKAVDRARSYDPARLIVAQLRGEGQPMVAEAESAVSNGAGVLMIDTGDIRDLRAVARAAEGGGWRGRVQLAFGGGITPQNVAEVAAAGADLVDVGRAIIDAPMLDFSLDVEGRDP